MFKKQQLFSHRFTQMNAGMFKHKEITDIILRTFYEAYNELGDGFLEFVPLPLHMKHN
jgi:hypothetical protein